MGVRASKRIEKKAGIKRKLDISKKNASSKKRKMGHPVKEIKPKKQEWEVEKILDMEVQQGQEMFFIKWKGFSNKHNTWEPREHLTSCEEALERFLDAYGYEV